MIRTNHKKFIGFAGATAFALGLALWLATPVTAGPGDFWGTAAVDPSPEVELCLGDTLTLEGSYDTNKDETKEEWLIEAVSQGVKNVPDGLKQHGSDFFDFLGSQLGDFTLTFHIWHHQQSDRNLTANTTVHVVDCSEDLSCPAAPAVAGHYLKDVKGMRPSNPLYNEIIEEIAHVMHEEFGYDPCAPGYADDVEAYIDANWSL